MSPSAGRFHFCSVNVEKNTLSHLSHLRLSVKKILSGPEQNHFQTYVSKTSIDMLVCHGKTI